MRRASAASVVALVPTTILLATTMYSSLFRSVGAWGSRNAVHRCSSGTMARPAIPFRTSSALYSTETDEYDDASERVAVVVPAEDAGRMETNRRVLTMMIGVATMTVEEEDGMFTITRKHQREIQSLPGVVAMDGMILTPL